jgi:hypothetical protein
MALGIIMLCGCSQNQCPKEGQTKCNGSQIYQCQEYDSETSEGEYLQWFAGRPCPDYCVEVEGHAYCSPVSAPIPECAVDGDGCWQDTEVVCLGGYPLEVDQHCRVDAGETCVVTDDPRCAYCRPAAGVVTNPACGCLEDTNFASDAGICFPGVTPTCMSEDTLIQCACGFQLSEPAACQQCTLGFCSGVADAGAE